ncbi:hypothetical protein EV186_101753 [Labedaea rhizosphaerae]|uniref:Uncharacterized protein n=1 Tax=Labedaea rhizosphaerae TaxID=598644 RepID=A0A4V3D087_LABRH|nr:hypothetical protein EV186_101753 [Labedaea rhizosphaerae]
MFDITTQIYHTIVTKNCGTDWRLSDYACVLARLPGRGNEFGQVKFVR